MGAPISGRNLDTNTALVAKDVVIVRPRYKMNELAEQLNGRSILRFFLDIFYWK